MTATGFELVGKIFITATGFELVGKIFITATGFERTWPKKVKWLQLETWRNLFLMLTKL